MSSDHAIWTSLILPIYIVEVVVIFAAAAYARIMNSSVEEGWYRLSSGIFVWVTLAITSLVLPFWLPQFLVGPPSLDDAAAWYFITAVFLTFCLRNVWVLVRLGRQRVSWKGPVIRFNHHGAMTDIECKTLMAVKFGYFDVSLFFPSGAKLAIDRGSVGIELLLGNLNAYHPIFVWQPPN